MAKDDEDPLLCVLIHLCHQQGNTMQDCLAVYSNDSETSPYPENRPVKAVIGMLSFFSVLGTIGNALVLYVYIRKKNKIASTIFIICLAGTDFVTSCVIMPFTMVMEYLDYKIQHDAVCKLYFFLITCNVPFSAFIMVAIAIDRYLCICKPHCHLLDSRRSQIGVFSLLLVAFGLGVMTALFHGVYENIPVHDWTNSTDQEMFNYLLKYHMISESQESATPLAYQDICADKSAGNSSREQFCIHLEEVKDLLTSLYEEKCKGQEYVLVKHEHCTASEIYFSTSFRKTYQKIYASQFLVCFIIVFALYILIYKSVIMRRTKRLRARQKTNLRLLRDVSVTDTQTTADNGMQLQNGFEMAEMSKENRRAMLEKDNTLKEKYLLANIRTAFMLFVVTVVFIVAFLPSWLMAHGVVTFNAIVFYTYFAYNVSNPIIYAFLNPAFRRELRDLVSCRNFRSSVNKL